MSVVEDCLSEVLREAESGNDTFCVTLESTKDSSRWVQLTHYTVNAAYPEKRAPEAVLEEKGIRLPDRMGLMQWEAGTYATFEHSGKPTGPIAAFTESYMKRVLGMETSAGSLNIQREVH